MISDRPPAGDRERQAPDQPRAEQPPASLRRRITPIGRSALALAWSLRSEADAPRLVFSSRHGEYDRSYGLLQALAESGEVSPAEFSLSVHHALAGLFSIATGNRAGHTAVAAGPESFGYGLLEAAAAAGEDRRPVLLVHFDDRLPEPYGLAEEPVVAAMIIAPPEGKGDEIDFSVLPGEAPGRDDPALGFLEFLESGRPQAETRGERMTWRWCRAA
jgi:hypothetical protein